MLSIIEAEKLSEAIIDQSPITGLTHNFYRYPARFSPSFVRVAIEILTQPGDVVLDPFVGGGTTLVEASVLGRKAIGIDKNSLGIFISRVKTTPLTDDDINGILTWSEKIDDKLNLHLPPIRPKERVLNGYQKNISGVHTWPIRKILELALNELITLSSNKQKDFVRCVLLRTAQWAVDCRKNIPSAGQFRKMFNYHLHDMLTGIKNYSELCLSNELNGLDDHSFFPICLNRSVIGIEEDNHLMGLDKPRLILMSPPYPGVHILYHRWQIHGGKESPAPYWIANCVDGGGASYYTFGDRQVHDSGIYYEQLKDAFLSITRFCDPSTIIAQMVGFSNPQNQLEEYLSTLAQVGLKEIKISKISNSFDGRIWRTVPNRKWYNDRFGRINQRDEVVLFHKIKN